MKGITWSKTLSIGVEEVDEDHRKLVDIFNTLNHAVKDRDAPEYLTAVLDELVNCTVWHFSHEERLMLKYQYKDMEAHKAEHRELIETVKELQQELLQGGGEMTERHIEILERWLTEHILTTDMRLGAYLANVM
ncbi:bacteriohemerythrin [Sulfuricystis multivorans]|uniref:bacteriohemerythrin n=1 Tax=Sulfuricystis multivorans TaxID=2211108 RepID=UPI000F82B428|nr:bacteriohemerythrin [Sulfuricystis multivorans]